MYIYFDFYFTIFKTIDENENVKVRQIPSHMLFDLKNYYQCKLKYCITYIINYVIRLIHINYNINLKSLCLIYNPPLHL
jgi:hypothetical protein